MSPSTDEAFLPFSRPTFGQEEEEAVLRVLRSGWLTTGPEASSFELEWSERTKASHSLAVSSATAGLHLALLAHGIGPGDKVAVPDFTFTATAEVLRYVGAEPVFIDCAAGSFQMDTEAVARLLREKPGLLKAALPVHFAGEPCNPEFWLWAREVHRLIVIEDCAHAFPVLTPFGYLGTLGDAGVFSFYANKTITTGEGGMVCVRSKEAAEKVRILRLHGIDRDAFSRFQSRVPAWKYDVHEAGFKYNMTDIAAAIGRAQLRKADSFLQSRREIAQTYLSRQTNFPGWTFPVYQDSHAWHIFPVLVPAGVDRDKIIHSLFAAGVGVSVHYKPLHRMTYWANSASIRAEDFPEAENRGIRVISLPIWPGLGTKGAIRVMDCLLSVWQGFNG